MDFELTDTERMLAETARRVVARDVEPVLAELRQRGMSLSDVVETCPAGWQSVERIETRGCLG